MIHIPYYMWCAWCVCVVCMYICIHNTNRAVQKPRPSCPEKPKLKVKWFNIYEKPYRFEHSDKVFETTPYTHYSNHTLTRLKKIVSDITGMKEIRDYNSTWANFYDSSIPNEEHNVVLGQHGDTHGMFNL